MLVIDYAMVDIILFIFIVMMIFKNVAIISNRVRVSYFRYCPITNLGNCIVIPRILYCNVQRKQISRWGEEKDSIHSG